MISESTGISLNIATLPVAKKKSKNKTAANPGSNFGGGVARLKVAKAAVPKPPAKANMTVAAKPAGILKTPKPAVGSLIWKKFKHANKKDDIVEPSFVKPVMKPERIVKKKVRVKGSVQTIPPSQTSTVSIKKSKKSDNLEDKLSVQNSDVSDFQFLNSDDLSDSRPSVHKPKKSKSKNKFASDEAASVADQFKPQQNMGKTTSLFVNNPEIPNIPHRAVQPIREAVFSKLSFEDLELHPFLVKYLRESMGLTKMTTVQEKSIPVLLDKKDALIKSQTGSGKTLAFALPILHKLQNIRPKISRSDGVLALIVVPTRELALQVYEVFNKLVKSFTWIVPGYLVGGEKRKSEKARLRKGISILIGTPGRLIDHVQHTKALSLDKVTYLVIDEADRLMDMGYEKDVSVLLDVLDKNETRLLKPSYLDPTAKPKTKDETKDRQTVLLSATLSQKVEKLAGLSLKEPVFIDASDEHSATKSQVPVFTTDLGNETETMVLPESLTQKYVVTPPKLKLVTLASFILRNSKSAEQKKMLIFIATQDMVDYYAELLSSVFSPQGGDDDSDEEDGTLTGSGIRLFKLHGNMKQSERTEVFKTFRKSQLGVLLCTDVAARGLDLPEVDCVIQYTGPTSVSDYVHRVGRTARGGQTGSSVLLLTPNEVRFIEKLEKSQIRLREEKMESCLGHLSASGRGSLEEEATKLQSKFEDLVAGRKELYESGCKAFASWSRFYASYPRSMRDAFSVKDVHQGHFAKSFALRDSPTAVISYARKKSLNEDRSPGKRPRERREPDKPRRFPGKSRLAEMSEFDSGLEPLPKRRKK